MAEGFRAATNKVLGIAVGLVVMAGEVAGSMPPGDGVHAAYVLFASAPEDGVTPLPFARLIIEPDRDCPLLNFENGPVVMTERRNPDVETGRNDFPVKVCEARYVLDQAVPVEGTGIVLPRVSLDPANLIVFGDTGCRGLPNQDCDNLGEWPFPDFAEVAVSGQPDLVIHVGDFNYIGTPGTFDVEVAPGQTEELKVFDAGDNLELNSRCQQPNGYASQNMSNSLEPDIWDNWRVDFFAPARGILMAAPWVFGRGNHELCSRAGPGWFYFLDPSSDLLGPDPGQLSCPGEDGGDPLLYLPPYRLDFDPLTLIVMDTTKACDITKTPELTKPYVKQFKRLNELVPERPTWLVMHRPIWGVLREKPDQAEATPPFPGKIEVVNKTLQHALRIANGGRQSLPPSVQLVLAGHQHRFQALTFGRDRPPQLIFGNSGRELTTDVVGEPFSLTVDGAKASGLSMNEFGYLDLLLDATGAWQGDVINPVMPPGSRVLAECGTDQLPTGSICRLPAN
jgi:hypothetical protein